MRIIVQMKTIDRDSFPLPTLGPRLRELVEHGVHGRGFQMLRSALLIWKEVYKLYNLQYKLQDQRCVLKAQFRAIKCTAEAYWARNCCLISEKLNTTVLISHWIQFLAYVAHKLSEIFRSLSIKTSQDILQQKQHLLTVPKLIRRLILALSIVNISRLQAIGLPANFLQTRSMSSL